MTLRPYILLCIKINLTLTWNNYYSRIQMLHWRAGGAEIGFFEHIKKAFRRFFAIPVFSFYFFFSLEVQTAQFACIICNLCMFLLFSPLRLFMFFKKCEMGNQFHPWYSRHSLLTLVLAPNNKSKLAVPNIISVFMWQLSIKVLFCFV